MLYTSLYMPILCRHHVLFIILCTNYINLIIIIIISISKSLTQYLSNIPEKNKVKKLIKTAIFGTEDILRNVLM
jgi:hypothetical protein